MLASKERFSFICSNKMFMCVEQFPHFTTPIARRVHARKNNVPKIPSSVLDAETTDKLHSVNICPAVHMCEVFHGPTRNFTNGRRWLKINIPFYWKWWKDFLPWQLAASTLRLLFMMDSCACMEKLRFFSDERHEYQLNPRKKERREQQ